MTDSRERGLRETATHWYDVPLAAVLALLSTATVALVWSHFKVIWFDEFLEIATDGVGSLREVLRIQRRWPIALDPALFHVVEHLSSRVFGVAAFGMRLPSLLGFLLAQASVFLFVRRIAGSAAGTVAAILPALSGMLLYAAEARPYALLCGMYGVAMVAYQQATRAATQRHRLLALVVLAFAIACAINLSWLGVLILAPLGIAELVRIVAERRVDWRMLLSFGVGLAGSLLLLPFRAAVARYHLHYYANAVGALDHRLPVLWYRELLLSYVSSVSLRGVSVVLLLLSAAVLFLAVRARRARAIRLPAAELALLCALTLLPFLGYVAASVATHAMAMRYVMSAGLGMAALLAIAVAPWLQPRWSRQAIPVLLFAALVANGAVQIHRERVAAEVTFQKMRFTPAVTAAMRNAPGGAIYMTNVFPYATAIRYTPDEQIRRELTLLYSFDQEMALRGRDTYALTAEHMQHFTHLPIACYEDVRRRGGRALFVISRDVYWDWPPDALRRDGATMREIGDAYGGKLVEATFPASNGERQR